MSPEKMSPEKISVLGAPSETPITPPTHSFFFGDLMNPAEAKSIGRPKGTCNAEARSLAMRVELATTEATEELEKVNKSRNKKKRLHKGLLDEIIKKSKLKHGVDEDIVILKQTVRQRLKRGSTSGHVGQTRPMAEVEPYLVQLIIQLSNMRTPISCAQGLKLANSLISGTEVEKK
jgi:hypothetical protein